MSFIRHLSPICYLSPTSHLTCHLPHTPPIYHPSINQITNHLPFTTSQITNHLPSTKLLFTLDFHLLFSTYNFLSILQVLVQVISVTVTVFNKFLSKISYGVAGNTTISLKTNKVCKIIFFI